MLLKARLAYELFCMNLRSEKNKALAICDFSRFDLLAVTETWLGISVDKTCISEFVPPVAVVNVVGAQNL